MANEKALQEMDICLVRLAQAKELFDQLQAAIAQADLALAEANATSTTTGCEQYQTMQMQTQQAIAGLRLAVADLETTFSIPVMDRMVKAGQAIRDGR